MNNSIGKTREQLLAENQMLKKQIQDMQMMAGIQLDGPNTVSSNSEFVALVNENTHDFIFIHDLDGKILGLNKVLSDFAPSNNVENIRDLLAPEVKNKFDEYLRRIIEDGTETGYMKVLNKHGQKRILKYHNKLVEASGRKIVQGLAHDITDLWIANRKLKSSEESYRGLFDSSETPTFILNQKGKIINANKMAIEEFADAKKYLVGESFDKVCFYSQYDKQEFNKLLKVVWEKGKLKRYEYHIQEEVDGKVKHRAITVNKGQYHSEDVLIVYNNDITEHKIAEQKLREEVAEKESENRLQKVYDKLNLLMFIVDANGKIKYCNNFLTKFTGIKKEEVVGQEFATIFEIKDENIDFSNLTQENAFLNKFEVRIKSKYGDTHTFAFNTIMITDSSHQLRSISLMGEDITESTRVARALRDSNKKLQDLFDNANDLIQIFTTDLKFTFVNNAWKNVLGYSDDEIEELTFDQIIASEHRKDTMLVLDRIKAGDKIDTFDSVFVTKSNKIIYVTGSVNCKIVDGKPVEFRGLFYDNTDKVRAERAQNLYLGIANLAIKSDNLDTLFQEIHKLLKKYIDVNNFHVALYDEKKEDRINFPCYIDENMPGITTYPSRTLQNGLTEYSLLMQMPIFLQEEDILKLVESKTIEPLNRIPKIWMGVPLKVDNRIIGVIAVKSYSDRNKYRQRHLNMLDFVSGQIALAIERKRFEAKIQNQSAKLNSIFESSQHLIWSINTNQELTSFNKNYADAIFQLHKTLPQLDTRVVEPRLLLSSEEFRPFIGERYKQAFLGTPQHYETYIKEEGSELITWRETYLSPIFDKEGSIVEVSGITHDITEKKQTELALRESEEKFRDIFESFQDIYYRTDIDGMIEMISPSVKDLTGFSPEEMIGKKIFNYYENPKKQEKHLKQLLTRGSVRNFEVNIKTKDGRFIPTISNIRIIFDNNYTPIAIDGVARDISELKKASGELLKAKEIAEKSLKTKELFLANMSHEIRTPMNGIIGMIDLLGATPLNTEQKDYVDTLKKSSETLLAILNDILDLSKLEAGKMQLRYVPVDFKDTINKIYALFLQKALIKGIEFKYYYDEKAPQYIMADETRLLQIISNLTSNAIKFTDKGSVKIFVKYLGINHKKVILMVEVQDSGIGIAQESINLLFDAFKQLDNTSSKSYGGTGLGLAISRQLTGLMGGNIGVNSELGDGSTFWFTFETEASEIIPEKLSSEAQTLQQLSFTNYTPYILLVDDNKVNRMVGGEILKKTGCKVEYATNGKEAIDKVNDHDFDIVLMDIQMPEMDGVTATQHIRKLDKKLPPIIAMTAYSMQEDRERFISAGMDDYLSKPIRPETLLNKLKEWIIIEHLSEKKTSETELDNPQITQGFVPENHAMLNKDTVKSLIEMAGEEMLLEIFEDFNKEATILTDNLKRGMAEDNVALVKSALHTIKGTAGTLGLDRISKFAQHIENNIKIDKFDSLNEEIKHLLFIFNNYFEEYRDLLKQEK